MLLGIIIYYRLTKYSHPLNALHSTYPTHRPSTKYRHGVKQKNFEVLCVSQFTLYGTLSKKNQPDYKLAMKAVPAEALYCQFLSMLRQNYEDDKIFDGEFGAMMDVELINDGPVTLVIDSAPKGLEVVNDVCDDAGTRSAVVSGTE